MLSFFVRFSIFFTSGYVYGYFLFSILKQLLIKLGIVAIYKVLLLLAIILPIALVFIVALNIFDIILVYAGLVFSYIYYISSNFKSLLENV